MPFPQVIEPRMDLTEADVGAAIEEARELVSSRGKHQLIWSVGPEFPWLGKALAVRGLLNRDIPGFDAVWSAMTLTEPPIPSTTPRTPSMKVEIAKTFEEFEAGQSVTMTSFDIAEKDQATARSGMPELWAELCDPSSPTLYWNASIGDEVVGSAAAVLLEAGLNMLGGAVHPAARGTGVYRALVQARWDEAARRGTPALTVQAGRMSAPILRKLGFADLATASIYLDDLSTP